MRRETAAPDPWIARFAPAVVPGGTVLDVACGSGRHSRLFLARGHPVTAVDIDPGRLQLFPGQPRPELVTADLENDPWPFVKWRFAAVVVVNYLWRSILPRILDTVDAGGMLL